MMVMVVCLQSCTWVLEAGKDVATTSNAEMVEDERQISKPEIEKLKSDADKAREAAVVAEEAHLSAKKAGEPIQIGETAAESEKLLTASVEAHLAYFRKAAQALSIAAKQIKAVDPGNDSRVRTEKAEFEKNYTEGLETLADDYRAFRAEIPTWYTGNRDIHGLTQARALASTDPLMVPFYEEYDPVKEAAKANKAPASINQKAAEERRAAILAAQAAKLGRATDVEAKQQQEAAPKAAEPAAETPTTPTTIPVTAAGTTKIPANPNQSPALNVLVGNGQPVVKASANTEAQGSALTTPTQTPPEEPAKDVEAKKEAAPVNPAAGQVDNNVSNGSNAPATAASLNAQNATVTPTPANEKEGSSSWGFWTVAPWILALGLIVWMFTGRNKKQVQTFRSPSANDPTPVNSATRATQQSPSETKIVPDASVEAPAPQRAGAPMRLRPIPVEAPKS